MSRIRADLIGVVHVYGVDDRSSVLQAGDEVPEGVELGEHLVEPEKAPSDKSAGTKKS